MKNALYAKFRDEAGRFDNHRVLKVADALIKDVIRKDQVGDQSSQEKVVQLCLDFMEFDAFQELAKDLTDTDLKDPVRLLELFREWEMVEAKEMMRVTEGRISTIERLQSLIDTNALEVPTLHNFLKEFPWVLDPRWTLVADEVTYTELLRNNFPEGEDVPEGDRRIDFMCVKESNNLVVVEIKRPQSHASLKELGQVEQYVNFMRNYCKHTTDPELKHREVVGYLLCGELVNTWDVREKRDNLERAGIYIRLYSDLLRMVRSNHKEFLQRYEKLRKAKAGQRDDYTNGAKKNGSAAKRKASSKKPKKAPVGKKGTKKTSRGKKSVPRPR